MTPVDHPNLQFNYDAQGIGSCDVEMHCGEKVDDKSRKAGRIWQALMSTDEPSGKVTKPASAAKFWLKSALVIVVVGSLLAWAWMPPRHEEPVYQGKTLREWLMVHVSHVQKSEEAKEAEAAIRNIGTNGIPTLLRMLQASDYDFDNKLKAFAMKHRLTKSGFVPAKGTRFLAFSGFYILGEDAKIAVSAKSRQVRHFAIDHSPTQCDQFVAQRLPLSDRLLQDIQPVGRAQCFQNECHDSFQLELRE